MLRIPYKVTRSKYFAFCFSAVFYGSFKTHGSPSYIFLNENTWCEAPKYPSDVQSFLLHFILKLLTNFFHLLDLNLE